MTIVKFFWILLLTSSLMANGQSNPFDTLKFDKVIMFDFNEKGREIFIIDKNGRLDKSVTKQIVLDEKTAEELNKRLGSSTSYVEGAGLCFFPHLGFVYYRRHEIVASITVCLMCHRLESSITIPAQIVGVLEDKGETLYATGGISDSMMDYLNNLVKVNKFSHPVN